MLVCFKMRVAVWVLIIASSIAAMIVYGPRTGVMVALLAHVWIKTTKDCRE
jgi:hypothetical protein